jgi:Flp pilus assembly protein protease CpaA
MPDISIVPPAVAVAVKIGVTVWMVAVAWVDWRTAHIPNWLVGPVMLGGGLIRIGEGFFVTRMRFLLLVAWVLIFLLWNLNFIGGGDAKFLMGLYALFPNMEWTAFLALVLLAITVPLLLRELWKQGIGQARKGMMERLLTGQVLPSRTDLDERGRQYAWTFAVPGILYAWLYW